MEKFHIVGPTRLAGRVAASGAKNAALPALTASLLSDETLTLRRVPRVRDIRTLLKLLDHLGMASQEEEDGALSLRRERPNPEHDAPYDLVKTMRASVLVLGPLLAKEGHARVSLPGGCAIGVRPIDQHLKALTALGAEVTLSHGYVETRAKRLTGARFRFDMPTVTGTENVLMAAALARGTTVLENCAREPEVIDLANLLNAMGARISGAGEETIVIDGVDGLGAAEHTIIPDRIEGGTYLIGAALTGGDVLLENANAADLAPLLDKLAEVGARVEVTAEGIRVRADQGIAARDLETAPHPGLPHRPPGAVHDADDPRLRSVDDQRDDLRKPLPARPGADADGGGHPRRRRRAPGPRPLAPDRRGGDGHRPARLGLPGAGRRGRRGGDGDRPHLPPRPWL